MNIYVCPRVINVINHYSSWLRQLLHEQISWPFLQDGMAVYINVNNGNGRKVHRLQNHQVVYASAVKIVSLDINLRLDQQKNQQIRETIFGANNFWTHSHSVIQNNTGWWLVLPHPSRDEHLLKPFCMDTPGFLSLWFSSLHIHSSRYMNNVMSHPLSSHLQEVSGTPLNKLL